MVPIEEAEFCDHVRQHGIRHESLTKMFTSAYHKLPREWANMLLPGLRWRSPTPASSRHDLSAYLWMIHYRQNIHQYLDIGPAWHSRLLTKFALLHRLDDDSFMLVVGVAKWCFIALSVYDIASAAGDNLYGVGGKVVEVLWGQLLVVQKWRGQGLCHG